ncbi:MAG: phytanoyl-CoA dioxygenase family protein [Chitinophagales bacterium]
MRRVFNDLKLEAEFQQNGYVIVDFLGEEEVARLKQQYFDGLAESGGNIESAEAGIQDAITYDFTFINRNIAYKQAVFNLITKAFQQRVDQYLHQYTPLIANFIRKRTNDGEVPLHQNWAFVDERKYTSVSIWCPLVDSDEQNGTLQVVPGSHKRFGAIRGPKIPWELEGIKKEIINRHLTPMRVRAGQAVILDDSLVHYSAINKTDGLRLAIQLILMPQEASSIHYHLEKPGDKVRILPADVAFYMHFNPWKSMADATPLEVIRFKPFAVSEKQFVQGLQGGRIDDAAAKTGWLERLKSMVS